MKRTVTDAVGTVRSHPHALVTLGVMALIGLASEGFDRLWHLHILNGHRRARRRATSHRSCGPRALEAAGLLCAVALTEVVRRRADLDSDRGVERTAEAVVVGMIVGRRRVRSQSLVLVRARSRCGSWPRCGK